MVIDSEAFEADPSKVWQFYHYRRSVVLDDATRPNAAHFALARLLLSHYNASLNDSAVTAAKSLPRARSFNVITQNVDGLSHRALEETHAKYQQGPVPRQNILEMHGNVLRTICTKCGDAQLNHDSPICEALRDTEDLTSGYQPVPISQLPRCRQTISQGQCLGLLRPGVVWFGESIPDLPKIGRLIQSCDLIMVLGTSSTVYPAASFAEQVRRNGGQVAVFNTDLQSNANEVADWYFQSPVEQLLPEILGV